MWRTLCLFHSRCFIFSTQLPFQEWTLDQTDLTLLQSISNAEMRTLRKGSSAEAPAVSGPGSKGRRASSVLSGGFTSKGPVSSCGSVLPCQQHSWLPHYINFLFPFEREFIQLNSFKSFIFSFLKRSICILFVLVLGGFQKSCLSFLHFQQKIKPSTKWMGHCRSGEEGGKAQAGLFSNPPCKRLRVQSPGGRPSLPPLTHWRTDWEALWPHYFQPELDLSQRIELPIARTSFILHAESQLKNKCCDQMRQSVTLTIGGEGGGGERQAMGPSRSRVGMWNDVFFFFTPWTGLECVEPWEVCYLKHHYWWQEGKIMVAARGHWLTLQVLPYLENSQRTHKRGMFSLKFN